VAVHSPLPGPINFSPVNPRVCHFRSPPLSLWLLGSSCPRPPEDEACIPTPSVFYPLGRTSIKCMLPAGLVPVLRLWYVRTLCSSFPQLWSTLSSSAPPLRVALRTALDNADVRVTPPFLVPFIDHPVCTICALPIFLREFSCYLWCQPVN